MRRTMIYVLAALTVVTVACSKPDQPPDAEPEDGETAAFAYSECMREHGFDWPDPVRIDGGWDNPVPEGIDPESPEFEDAQTECAEESRSLETEDLNPDDQVRMDEEMERMLTFAKCMRDQGIDFPDPMIEEDGISGPAGPVDGDWEAFDEARAVCEEETGAPMP